MKPAKVRSLGLTTDLMLIGWDGVVDVLDGGVVRARTPENPDFFFGNFLVFPEAPAPGDAHAWVTKFHAAFADDPRVRHVCLRWDRTDGAAGAAEELRAAGFTLEETVVLRSSAPVPPPRRADAELRRILSDDDWAQVEALQVATMVAEFGEHAASFARAQMSRYRRFVSSGRGAWFGAFVGGTLAADMGVFVGDEGLARFQAVETAAAFRRRGMCGTLAHHAAQVALAELGARTLVLVGLPDHTADIYESVGFERVERLVAAVRGR
jgi:hypothetical protein